MCGMIGFHVKERKWDNFKQREDWLRAMFTVCSLRGEDSTGVALVSRDGLREEPSVYKAAVPPWYFINSKVMNIVEARLLRTSAVLGHCRAATQGLVNEENAHPFQIGSVTLTHNGTIQERDIPDVTGMYATDSARVTALLSQAGVDDAHTVLGELGGAWALVWHDQRDGSLNFARNTKRPLWFGVTPDRKALFWASEDWMLDAGASRAHTVRDIELSEVPTHRHIKYKLDDEHLMAYVRPIKECEDLGGWSNGSYGARSNSYYVSPVKKWERSSSVAVPSWAYIGKTVDFVGLDFQQYGERTTNGQLVGALIDAKEADAPVKLTGHSVPQAKWKPYAHTRFPVFTGTISGATYVGEGKNRYLSVNLRDVQYVSSYKKYLKRNPDVQPALQDPDMATTNVIALPPPAETVRGPGGVFVPTDTFNSMVADGCAWCGGNIFPVDADNMMWTPEKEPVCPPCVPEVKQYNNLVH